MATVFRAHDLRLGRDVAIKVLFEHLAEDSAIAARFEREARALAAVNHPNVIGVLDVEGGERPPFIVLELADGGTLADRIRARGALDPDEVVAAVRGIAAGLAAIHAVG